MSRQRAAENGLRSSPCGGVPQPAEKIAVKPLKTSAA